ncbi:MAG: hypothetical protein VST68_13005 [Nitrospirota bacterium]|nr:hypothetical protein [Nitrospirota bacterium]
MNISLTWPIHALGESNISRRRECSKKSALSPAQTQGGQDALSTGQAAPSLARGAYSQYVSANVAKSGKSVCEPEGQATWQERRWRLFFNIPL